MHTAVRDHIVYTGITPDSKRPHGITWKGLLLGKSAVGDYFCTEKDLSAVAIHICPKSYSQRTDLLAFCIAQGIKNFDNILDPNLAALMYVDATLSTVRIVQRGAIPLTSEDENILYKYARAVLQAAEYERNENTHWAAYIDPNGFMPLVTTLDNKLANSR